MLCCYFVCVGLVGLISPSFQQTVSTKKTRILDVVYNASNNELVRTKTLVKNSIIQIDATPFRTWYEAHYGVKIGAKRLKKLATTETTTEDVSTPSLSLRSVLLYLSHEVEGVGVLLC